MKTPDTAPGHVSRAKDPAIVAESQSVIRIIGRIFWTVAIMLIVLVLFLGIRGCKAKAEAEKAAAVQAAAEYARTHPPTPSTPLEYPISGSGHATTEVGLKCWLDPHKTFTRPSRPAKYVFLEDPEVSWEDTFGAKVEPNSTKHRQEWLAMPAGKYLVYPLGVDKIYFRWWQ